MEWSSPSRTTRSSWRGKYSRFPGDRPFDLARALGVTRQRVNLLWAYTLPERQFNARRKPADLNYNFSNFDRLIDRLPRSGVRVHVSSRARRRGGRTPAQDGAPQLVQAERDASSASSPSIVAEHFAGRVDRYSIWNEPNWKTWLGPLKAGPSLYRQLYLRGYKAIKAADPAREGADRRDRAVLEARLVHVAARVPARRDVRERNYRRARRCPKLRADGYAHHPYDFGHAPNYKYPGADNVTIGTLSRLTRALDRLSRAGVLRKNGGGRMPLYLTEYGYFASGQPRAAEAEAVEVPPAGVLDRPEEPACEEPAPVPAGLAAAQPARVVLRPGLVNTRGRKNVGYNALQRWYRKNRGKVKRPGGAISLAPAPPNPVG